MESQEGAAPKQVIVMRRDLGMRRGKEIAQGAHASMIWLAQRIREPGYFFTEAERRWLDGAFTKVCVRVESEEELLAAARLHGFPISYDELVECVETNDKQRFAFDVSGELIRANQGHSVEIDLQLEAREPPETLYHGTVERFLPSILEMGLVRGKRHHVHLSGDVDTARRVGARRGKPVILTVDAGRMHREGHKFFLSANGVWLTDAVPPGYLSMT